MRAKLESGASFSFVWLTILIILLIPIFARIFFSGNYTFYYIFLNGLFCFVLFVFFPGICRCETDTCAVFHTTRKACSEVSLMCLSQGHNNVIPNTGMEPATLRSLA